MSYKTCRICGLEKEGIPFDQWVKDTFTNHDLLHPGDVICDDCMFWFNQRSEKLQRCMGKEKPQKMQNYSHFMINGEWLPVSKGDKRKMAAFLLDGDFPEMAVIAVSGQKHLAFRARRNPAGSDAGWVQYEEQTIWIVQGELKRILTAIEDLYTTFSKSEIESGHYPAYKIIKFGLERWAALIDFIRPVREKLIFQVALFLAQRSEDEGDSSDVVEVDLAGNTVRLQEPLPHDDLGTIRERNQGSRIHQQSGEVCQLDLFAIES